MPGLNRVLESAPRIDHEVVMQALLADMGLARGFPPFRCRQQREMHAAGDVGLYLGQMNRCASGSACR